MIYAIAYYAFIIWLGLSVFKSAMNELLERTK